MSGKHTKGPWKYREIAPFDDGLGYISADEHDIMHAGVSDIPAEENRANGYLAASAPLMLEALEALANDRSKALGSIHRKRINAAISAAKGE